MNTTEIFASNIIKMRERLKISQSELAVRLNMSSAGISKLEKGRTYPSLPTIKMFALEFGTTIDRLISENTHLNKDEKEKQKESLFYSKFKILENLKHSDTLLVIKLAERLSRNI